MCNVTHIKPAAALPSGKAQQRGHRVRCSALLDRPFLSRFRIGTPFGGMAQHLDDMLGQIFLDFPMPRHRLRNTCHEITVPVVLASMPHQYPLEPFDRLDEIDPLHDTTNSSTLRMPGSSPLVRS